jgi:hypothetical protein
MRLRAVTPKPIGNIEQLRLLTEVRKLDYFKTIDKV